MNGPERDVVRYGKTAFRDERLIGRKRLRLEEAIRVVRVNTGDDRVAAGLCNVEKTRGGICAVCAQSQQIELQRNVQLLRGKTQPLHFRAVKHVGAGEVDEIRMRQIRVQPGLQGCNTLVDISF